MAQSRWNSIALAVALALPIGAQAGEQSAEKQRPRTQTQQQIYGSQLMTPEERTEYRNKMRSAKTDAERDRIRGEHHTAMQERAREKGMTLPEQPSAKGGARRRTPFR